MNWSSGRRCWVLVLGDFGRSPRMQYHTESLLKKGLDVTVIAFPDSKPLTSIASHPRCTFAAVPHIPPWLDHFPGPLFFLMKALFQMIQLLVMMFIVLPAPDFMLVQIPPAIPTLFICILVRLIHRTRIFLDWHNFAFTLMRLNPRVPAFLVSLSRCIEIVFGRMMDGHFCVSQAMQTRLKKWRINAIVVYDRPHERYKPTTLAETHALLSKLCLELSVDMHADDFCAKAYQSMPEMETILTQQFEDGEVIRKQNRPALIVSSTSWTADEDFSILLEALDAYDKRWNQLAADITIRNPRLLVLITGRGQLRAHYIEKMKEMKWTAVAVRTLWLEADDYPLLLGSADFGISLHTSSSGVDLPMKVVDMFGCGLPVCSPDYPAISELVKSPEKGLLFHSSDGLLHSIWNLLHDFYTPVESFTSLRKMKRALVESHDQSWHENWQQTVWKKLSE